MGEKRLVLFISKLTGSFSNCTVHNQTFTSMQISCGSGFDGGLKQMFKLDVRDAVTGFPLLNMSQVAELIDQWENSIN